jgi:hypothetical protein
MLQHAFLEELERTVALLAFEDTANCPVGELLDISQRQKTASELNAAILTSQSHEKGLTIEIVLVWPIFLPFWMYTKCVFYQVDGDVSYCLNFLCHVQIQSYRVF